MNSVVEIVVVVVVISAVEEPKLELKDKKWVKK